MKGKSNYTKQELLNKLPKQYHQMIDVFMKSKADELFIHRKENHEINLTSGAISSYEKNYRSMSKQELVIVKKYINEHLNKKLIRFNFSATSSPILLTRKSKKKIEILREL